MVFHEKELNYDEVGFDNWRRPVLRKGETGAMTMPQLMSDAAGRLLSARAHGGVRIKPARGRDGGGT